MGKLEPALQVNHMPRTSKPNANDPEKEETANTSMQVTQTMQTEAVQTQTIQRSSPPNHIFVGKKPVMSYAMSALIQLTQAGEIVVKARGMAISRAVDVAEIVTKRLGNGAFSVKDIRIGTEVVGEGSETRNISSIEIVVGK